MAVCHSDPDASGEESLTLFMAVAALEAILRSATIGMLQRVRPSIRFCLSSWAVRCKGEAFSPRRCKLKKFNVVQPKISIVSLFDRKMLRPYKSGRTIREPDAIIRLG